MAGTDPEQMRRGLEMSLIETGVRIRRYTLDDHLKEADLARLDKIWEGWLALRDAFYQLAADAPVKDLRAVEHKLLEIDRSVDLIQRLLVSGQSFRTGNRTALLLAAALLGLIAVYLLMHGVRGLDFSG